jgi:hypothetical protein
MMVNYRGSAAKVNQQSAIKRRLLVNYRGSAAKVNQQREIKSRLLVNQRGSAARLAAMSGRSTQNIFSFLLRHLTYIIEPLLSRFFILSGSVLD